MKVWEAATGKVRLSLQWDKDPRYRGAGWDPRESPPFSADGRRLVLAIPGGGVRVWDLDTFRVVFACDTKALALEISPDGRKVAMLERVPDDRGREGDLTLWDVDTQTLLSTKPLSTLVGYLAWCKYSPDGSRVAVLVPVAVRRDRAPSYSSEVVALDTATGAELLTLKDKVGLGPMTFSPDGKILATTARSTEDLGVVLLWDVATGKELLRLQGHSGRAFDLAFSPDSQRLASVAVAGVARAGTPRSYEVKLWDTATGSEFLQLKRDGQRKAWIGYCLSFSPDGHRLLGRDLSGTDGSVETIWDATPRPEEPAGR